MHPIWSFLGKTRAAASVPLPQANHALNASEVKKRRITLRFTPLQVNVDLTGLCNVDPPCVFCSGKNVGWTIARSTPSSSNDTNGT